MMQAILNLKGTYRTFQNFLSLRVCVEHSKTVVITSFFLNIAGGIFATRLDAARADICRTMRVDLQEWGSQNIRWLENESSICKRMVTLLCVP